MIILSGAAHINVCWMQSSIWAVGQNHNFFEFFPPLILMIALSKHQYERWLDLTAQPLILMVPLSNPYKMPKFETKSWCVGRFEVRRFWWGLKRWTDLGSKEFEVPTCQIRSSLKFAIITTTPKLVPYILIRFLKVSKYIYIQSLQSCR